MIYIFQKDLKSPKAQQFETLLIRNPISLYNEIGFYFF